MIHSPTPFDLPQLTQQFRQLFGDQTNNRPAAFHAPGRVNLIGEHTDYTGGMVFPCAIDRGTLLLIRISHSNRFRLASTNFDATADLALEDINQPVQQNLPSAWVNYPLGVIDQFRQRGTDIGGLDCLYCGNVPNGAGLSSSASIEVVTAFAINQLLNAGLSNIELAKISQAAENEFVGMQCGIMDQFAVALCQPNHALKLNCESLDFRQVPLNLEGHTIVLVNTNQRRELNHSAYNDRVKECQQALALAQQGLKVRSLGEIRADEFESIDAQFIDDYRAYKRARHIVSENTRVVSAVDALENGDLSAFGTLMQQSHASLRDDFEVSSKPLDTLVELAMEQTGVLGARLTGAGFGGCTVNLMHQESVKPFQQIVSKQYHHITGLNADFYTITPSGGVSECIQ